MKLSYNSLKKIGLILIVLSFTLSTAAVLISYSHYDISLFYNDTLCKPISNWLGYYGSCYASLLLYFFGAASWFLVILGMLAGFELCGFFTTFCYADRYSGTLILFVTLLTLSAFVGFDAYNDIQPGGLCGSFMHGLLKKSLGTTTLEWSVLVTSLWISLILLFRFSWARFITAASRRIAHKLYMPNFFDKALSWWNDLRYAITTWCARVMHSSRNNELSIEDLVHDTSYDAPKTTGDNLFADPLWTQVQKKREVVSVGEIKSIINDKESPKLENESRVPYQVPPLSLLPESKEKNEKKYEDRNRHLGRILEEKLEHFGIHGKVISMVCGPTVTLFEYKPRIDMKISSIIAREDDLALALQALSLRIIAPIPGTAVIGFEVANQQRESVIFADCMKLAFSKISQEKLPLVLGKDIVGNSYVTDLASLPHLLIAGSTGSGKSVGLHTILMSLLFKLSPEYLKLILIDPKRIEFSPFADIPHLLFPIQTQPQMAIKVLEWAVKTMEERYDIMAREGVRHIHDYQAQCGKEAMPFMVIVIDELADLMMTAGKECEERITRLAQMSRAAGIHLIVATQRPSVDVITGLIKVNFPARIAFKVASKIDSRTILDASGAEKLLSKGDMLFLDPHGVISRIQGAFISGTEIASVVAFIKTQQTAAYIELPTNAGAAQDFDGEDQSLYEDVVKYLGDVETISISSLQRRFRIGYNRSARIFDRLEAEGLIASADGGKLRRVMKSPHESREQKMID